MGSIITQILENTIETANGGISSLKFTTILFYTVTTFTVVSLVSSAITALKNKAIATHFTKLAQKKRAQRDQQAKQITLPSLNISSQLQEKILNSDATGLLEMLKNHECTSE